MGKLTWKHTNELGFHERYVGTVYLRDVVNYILEKPSEERPLLVKEVYPAVAEKYGKRWTAVEKAIRHTITQSGGGKPGDVIWGLVARCREGEFDD